MPQGDPKVPPHRAAATLTHSPQRTHCSGRPSIALPAVLGGLCTHSLLEVSRRDALSDTHQVWAKPWLCTAPKAAQRHGPHRTDHQQTPTTTPACLQQLPSNIPRAPPTHHASPKAAAIRTELPPYLEAAISAFCLAMVAARSAASTARSTFSRILLARSGMRFFLLPLTRTFCLYLPSSLVPSGKVMQP